MTPPAREVPRVLHPAVAVRGIGKAFLVPNRRHTSLKERVADRFRRVEHDVFPALHDVSFQVERGEFFGVVGHNGSGKSTLLKIIAGIYEADAGSVEVAGRLSPFIEMGVGFKPDLTARENVMLNGAILGLSRRQLRERFDAIMAFAELESFADLKLKNFSSGMTVRLAFSMAVQVDADVLLVDEVLAVGDAAFQIKCHDQFERLKREGRTVLFVSHNMDAVKRFCDRALLLTGGCVAEIGPPERIAERYHELHRERAEERARLDARREEAHDRSGFLRPSAAAFASAGPPASYRPSALGEDLHRFVNLTLTLAKAEFRLHYQGSVLGYLWSVMRPLMLFTVLYLVFSRAARIGGTVEHYPVYLMSAIVLWTFFTEATSGGLVSLAGNSDLLRKMRFPRLAIPLSVALKALFNLGLNMLAVVVFLAIAGVEPRLSWLEVPLLVALLALLAVGLGMMLSTMYVRYRDTRQLWSVLQQLLFYSSPILYVTAHYPDSLRQVLALTPLVTIFTEMRHALIDPSAPSAAETVGAVGLLAVPVGIAVGCFALGVWLFYRAAPGIAERM